MIILHTHNKQFIIALDYRFANGTLNELLRDTFNLTEIFPKLLLQK